MPDRLAGRPFLLVGLTGGIATGKSTVSAMFRQLGCEIIDADLLAREIVAPGERALNQIVADFGADVVQADGTLDRKRLGAVIFADPAKRKRLEEITHPAIRDRFLRRLADLEARRFAGIVLWDAPVMIETGGHTSMDRLVVVATDEPTQLERLKRRDAIDEVEAHRKIRSQMPVAEKARLAHYVIDNRGERDATAEQVGRVNAGLHAELAVSTRALGHAAPLAIVLPKNMGHYGAHRISPRRAFASLATASACRFLAYHSNVSGNFVVAQSSADTLEDIARTSEEILGLACIARPFSALVQLCDAVPQESRMLRDAIVLRENGHEWKIVTVFFSSDVPSSCRVVGTLNGRVVVRHWVSARDVICLYDRPPQRGSVGQVTTAVERAVRPAQSVGAMKATGRAMSVVQDVVQGRLNFSTRSALDAQTH